MIRIPARSRAFMAVMFFFIAAASCSPKGPALPVCGTRTQLPTGDLSVDMVGDWSSSSNEPGDHPVVTFYGRGEAHRLWSFNADGSGYTWSLASRPDGDYYDEGAFTWHTDGDELFISQLPPLTVAITKDDRAHVRATPESDEFLWNRCHIEETAP